MLREIIEKTLKVRLIRDTSEILTSSNGFLMGSSIINFILGLPVLIIEVLVNILLSVVREWFDSWYKLVASILDLPLSNMEKLKNFFKTKPSVTDGEKVTKLYDIPVYQRSDGATIKLGAFVTRSDNEASSKANIFNVKRIAVRADLGKTCVIIVPTECGGGSAQDKGGKQGTNKVVEEITLDVNNVTPLKDKGVCPDTARNGMELVSRSAGGYPFHIQKFVRKHQLSSTMRKQLQTFLSGFSMAGTCSLGCINWQLDPTILGLERETDFSMEYRVERSVDKVTHMDLLMGDLWDVRSIGGTDGFRIILTMELVVDSYQELFLKMHGTLISSKLDTANYRAVCLKDSSNLHMVSNRRLSDITNNRTRRLSDITNNASGAHITPGQTLAWDEFQTQSAGNSPWRGQCGASGGVPSVTVSVDELFASGGSLSALPASSTTAMQTLEKLLSALPQSQIVFNSPIKEVSGEYSGLSSLQTGPNTSTPADDLDGTASGQGATPHSSPSLHDHKHAPEKLDSSNADMDEELESLQLKDNKTREKVTFAEEDQVVVEEVLEPTVPMNISPDIEESKTPDSEEIQDQARSKIYEQGATLKVDAFEEEKEVDSLKPSPNISTDFEENSTPSKSGTKDCKAQLNSNFLANSNLEAVTMSPVTNTKTSLKRVRDYIQSLPSPQQASRRGDGLNTESFPSELKTNLSMTEEGDTGSLCSGSQSLISRQSDMSSMTGARMGRGMFYGAGAGPTICTFPEEWNQIIPESIENDEDID